MPVSAAEQYMLELMNRARLDPEAEARRLGIDLSDSATGSPFVGGSRGVLAFNYELDKAATGHSRWMIDNDVFSHIGKNGSTPSERAVLAGHPSGVAENIHWRGSLREIDAGNAITRQYVDLMRESDHRSLMLDEDFREVGIAQELGRFSLDGTSYNASMVTQNFCMAGDRFYVTGVVYNDLDKDNFYSIGEGRGGATFRTAGDLTVSASSGGYALQGVEGGRLSVIGAVGTKLFTVDIVVEVQNSKLDVVDRSWFYTSADITLKLGINNARLLGTDALDAYGNHKANILQGNSGSNTIVGMSGNDRLFGNAGDDALQGAKGADRVFGGDGNDRMTGDEGNDLMNGGAGNDIMIGGPGADVFVFDRDLGRDIVFDFTSDDTLRFDRRLADAGVTTAQEFVDAHANVVNGAVVFDFASEQAVSLLNVSSLSGLADHIVLF